MNKVIICTAALLCAAMSLDAVPVAGRSLTPEQKAKRDEMLRDQYEYFGGHIYDTREQKGTFILVNCAKAVEPAWLQAECNMLKKEVFIAASVESGSFDLAKPDVRGSACIFVVDDPKLPMSLIAPESRWAMVNVAQLKTEKIKFFEMRTKKAVSRAFAILCGAASSQYPMALVENIQKAEDFDKYPDARLQYDLIRRFAPYLKGYGIVPFKRTNYRKACREGWAPDPTNDVQKAIWDEIHALPTKPIKIEPESKTQKK